MTNEEMVEQCARFFGSCLDLMRKKNTDYNPGGEAFEALQVQANVTGASLAQMAWAHAEKSVHAMRTFFEHGTLLDEEKVRDRLIDLANYSAIVTVLLEAQEDKEVADKDIPLWEIEGCEEELFKFFMCHGRTIIEGKGARTTYRCAECQHRLRDHILDDNGAYCGYSYPDVDRDCACVVMLRGGETSLPPSHPSDHPVQLYDLNELAGWIRDWRTRKGFKTPESLDTEEERDAMLGKLMLVVTEVAEAAEAIKANDMNNFHEEIADTVIRLLDIASAIKMNPVGVINAKMHVNEGRPHRHGKSTSL